jgi:hypothetical protein
MEVTVTVSLSWDNAKAIVTLEQQCGVDIITQFGNSILKLPCGRPNFLQL